MNQHNAISSDSGAEVGSAAGAIDRTPELGQNRVDTFEYSPSREREAISLYSSPLNKHTMDKIRKFRRSFSFKSTVGADSDNEDAGNREALLRSHGADAHDPEGEKKSTFMQATINGLNVLAGLGVLSLPFAFLQSGWLLGLVMLLYLCMVTNYTGKLIGLCMSKDDRIRTYSDLGTFAFGPRGRLCITAVFCIELIAALSMFIALMGDHLVAVIPSVSRDLWCGVATLVVLPTCMTSRLSVLSNLSIIGVLTTVFLLFVLVETGLADQNIHLSTAHFYAMGSMSTSGIPYSIGLQMVGFAGHAVFPSIYDSLEDKKSYPKIINVVYIFCTAIYVSMAFLGYLIFTDETKEEITLNLYDVAPNNFLVRLTVWLIIINPITKFALTLNPLVNIVEGYADVKGGIVNVALRTLLCALPCLLAVILPSFAVICAFVGAFCSFIVSGIFPIMCYLKIYGHTISRPWYIVNLLLIVVNSILCVMGTGAVFVPPKE